MDNIREFLGHHTGYHTINREERNLAAILYHVLLQGNNLITFLETISCDCIVEPEQMGIYFEYAYLRDLWFNIKENEIKRQIIYKFLKPNNLADLKRYSTMEFNTYFGAVPKPSEKYIQSPSNWSISKYKETIDDKEEFLKVSRFKWAFNAKPDIVIHSSHDTAICIECKVESGEGKYPQDHDEAEEFRRRGLDRVTQTSIQEYIMKLLGISTKHIYLVQKEGATSNTHTTLCWKQAFSNLNVDDCPIFIKQWIERITSNNTKL